MRHDISLPGVVYIESCGTMAVCGEVRQLVSRGRGVSDALCASQDVDDHGCLREVHNPDGAQHSLDMVDLCRRLAVPGTEAAATLIYVHRGQPRQCKTPLLQKLLAMLGPGLRIHGLRAEEARLQLDVVLFAIAALGESGRCLIVKDNSIRLGTTGGVCAGDVRHVLLSRAGPWKVEAIAFYDSDSDFAAGTTPLFLDDFVMEDHRCEGLMSLASRTTSDQLGIIEIVHV